MIFKFLFGFHKLVLFIHIVLILTGIFYSFNDTEDIYPVSGLECPHDAVYMQCAPACRPSCNNIVPNPACHTRRCMPGCYCPYPTVLHRGSCIPPTHCPQKSDVNKHRRRRNRFRNQSFRGKRLSLRSRNAITLAEISNQPQFSSARTVP